MFSILRPPDRRYERIRVPEATLGAALRVKRWKESLEQLEVARRLGVSKDTYRNWEMNRRSPSPRSQAAVKRWLAS